MKRFKVTDDAVEGRDALIEQLEQDCLDRYEENRKLRLILKQLGVSVPEAGKPMDRAEWIDANSNWPADRFEQVIADAWKHIKGSGGQSS